MPRVKKCDKPPKRPAVVELFRRAVRNQVECNHDGYTELVVAVITQAFDDAAPRRKSAQGVKHLVTTAEKDEARRFFHDGRLDLLCEMIHASPSAVRDFARRGTEYIIENVNLPVAPAGGNRPAKSCIP